MIGGNSILCIHNKLLIYKQILRPVWVYGYQLWGCAKVCNINIIKRFQNKVLRNIVDVPGYIRNRKLHQELGIKTVAEIIKKTVASHEQKLHIHVNVEAIQLVDNTGLKRRLKRTKPFKLV